MKKILLVVFLFLVLFYIPFINKAVHIDDNNFIEMSKALDFSLSVKPGFVYYFMGNKIENWNPFNSSHPPFIPIYLKITSLMTGYNDYLMHICFLLFPVLLLLSTFLLAKELNVEPIPALMIICGNAALLPVSHNLMADAPMLSLWILAAYFLISGIRKNLPGRIILAFIILTIAGFVSYQTFLILPAFYIYLIVNKRFKGVIVSAGFLPVLIILFVLFYIFFRYYSPISGIIAEMKLWKTPERFFMKGLSIPINIGVSMLFLLMMGYKEIAASKKDMLLAAISFLIVILPVLSLSYPLWSSLWLILLAAAGVFSILYASKKAFGRNEDGGLNLFLIAWLAIVLFYNFFFMTFGAIRYIMPAIVPLSIILMKNLIKGRRLMIAGLLTAALGLAVAYGDYLYASSYRDFAEEVKMTVGDGRYRVWYTGEWGMHYYMDKNGFRYLTLDSNEPKEGDLIIMAEVPNFWKPSPELRNRMKLIDIVEIKTWYPIKVMGLHVRAGYYSSVWGYQPFTVSDGYVEKFGIFRVIQ